MHRRGVLRWTMTVCLCFGAAMGAAQRSSMVIQGGEVALVLAPNPITWNQPVAKMRLWDNLIYNTERNLANVLITDSWQIRLIDHSRTFRPFEQLKDPKAPTTFSRSLLAKLEELNEAMLKEHLGKYLTPYQIQGILKRRDAILARSKELIAEKGAGAVLYQ